MLGCKAKAEVQAGDVIQTIQSGGLWGIESDCGDYRTQVENEELDVLASELAYFGFTSRAIASAFKSVENRQ